MLVYKVSILESKKRSDFLITSLQEMRCHTSQFYPNICPNMMPNSCKFDDCSTSILHPTMINVITIFSPHFTHLFFHI